MSPLSDRWRTFQSLSLSNRTALFVAGVLGILTTIALSPVLVALWLCQSLDSVFREPTRRAEGSPIPRKA